MKALKDLMGKVALITGAAGGIGRAFAAALAAEGAGPLALVDIDAEGLDGTAAMLKGAGYHIGVTCVCPGNVDTGLHWRTPIKGFAPGIKRYVRMTLAIAEGPQDTARSMVRAVKRGRFLVVTTPFARASYFMRRHFPAAWFACMKVSAALFARAADRHRARGEVL